MAAVTSASFWLTLLSVVLSVSRGHKTTRAESGQTVSLPCKTMNNDPVIGVEWSRTDLKEDEYVLLYRDKQLDPAHQHPSYKNRVDLQDRQMKDGDVSLILNNVTTDDSGTYECRVIQRKSNRMKRAYFDSDPSTIIYLDVVPRQINITAESGQTVSLPCKALNNEPVTGVEWSRTDMKEDEYVLFYHDDQSDPENQHPSYKNRVDLQDRQMKDGNVSLILNNVMTDDSGTYECYVETKTNRWKRAYFDADLISIIRLDVFSPGHTSGHKEEGRDKDGGDKDGLSGGHIGLIVVAAVVVLVAVVGGGFLIFRRCRHRGPYHPPPDPQQL